MKPERFADLCQNCNGPDASDWYLSRPGDEENGLTVGKLCEQCAEVLAELDLTSFMVRHENRPRTLELP